MNISELYGKKTESTDGRKGYVISVNANDKKLECFVCADAEENEFIIDVKDIISLGDKIIYEDRETAIKGARPIRLGRAGYDERGNFLGNLEDFSFNGKNLLKAKIGKKNYPAEGIVCGDVVIVKTARKLKYDVVKDGKIIIKKGTPVTEEMFETAEKQGEYFQAKMKTL